MTSPHHPDPVGPTGDDELDLNEPFDEGTVDEAADDALLELLGQALGVADPVPADVVAGARGAVAWRTIDQDLADLVFDSAAELTGVRDPNAARQLTFQCDDVEIELMLVDPTQRRLVGQVVPGRETTVTLEAPDRNDERTSDRFGRFSFDQVPTGPVRINVAGDPAIATDWVLL